MIWSYTVIREAGGEVVIYSTCRVTKAYDDAVVTMEAKEIKAD